HLIVVAVFSCAYDQARIELAPGDDEFIVHKTFCHRATEPQSHRGKKRGGDKEKGDKETRCFAAFPLVPLSPCLLVFLPLCVSVTLWQFKRSSPSPTGTSSGSGGNRKAVSSPRPRGCSRYYKGARL